MSNVFRSLEYVYQGRLEQALDDYRGYLHREVSRKTAQISTHYPEKRIEFISGMGSYFFKVGDNTEYKGFGAKSMIDRLDAALDRYGWNVIPVCHIVAINGDAIDV